VEGEQGEGGRRDYNTKVDKGMRENFWSNMKEKGVDSPK